MDIDIVYCFTSFYIALIQVPTRSYKFLQVPILSYPQSPVVSSHSSPSSQSSRWQPWQVKSQAEEAAKLAADSSKMIVETESFSAAVVTVSEQLEQLEGLGHFDTWWG